MGGDQRPSFVSGLEEPHLAALADWLACGPRGFRSLVGALFLVLVGACGGPSIPDNQGGGALLTEAHPESMRARGWLDFYDLSLHTEAEASKPAGLYMKGAILGGLFYPDGDIQGAAPAGGGRRTRFLREGWLSLRTRAFFPSSREHPPDPPYVKGAKDLSTGGFLPEGKVIRASAVQNSR